MISSLKKWKNFGHKLPFLSALNCLFFYFYGAIFAVVVYLFYFTSKSVMHRTKFPNRHGFWGAYV